VKDGGAGRIGAGGVSVPRGLAERVGTSGRVLATDIDVSWAEPAAGGALEVCRHDVIRDPPPAETFDLVHARLVLVHLKDRAAAMRVMIDALRPGGWLVIEDARTDDHRMGPQAGLTIHRGEGCLWQQICQWPCQCRLSGDAEFDRMDSRYVSVLSVLTAQSATAVHLLIRGLWVRVPRATVTCADVMAAATDCVRGSLPAR
jgi:SAM-dependent methyltransferase